MPLCIAVVVIHLLTFCSDAVVVVRILLEAAEVEEENQDYSMKIHSVWANVNVKGYRKCGHTPKQERGGSTTTYTSEET